VAETDAAARHLEALGPQRLLLVGSCFGALAALAAARSLGSRVAGVSLVSPFVAAYVRPVATVASRAALVATSLRRRLAGEDDEEPDWVSEWFLNTLAAVVEQGTALQIIFSEGDEAYGDFVEARRWRLGRILKHAQGPVEEHVLAGRGYIFARVERQQQVVELVADWASLTASASASRPPQIGGSSYGPI
jgi:pimeloyl-ACP methyl ester carboxylesterase